MFPKCSMDVLNITTLREHSANIPGILNIACRLGENFNLQVPHDHIFQRSLKLVSLFDLIF